MIRMDLSASELASGFSFSISVKWTEEHRRIYRQQRDGYPSDQGDADWARLEPLIPRASPGGRPGKTDMRAAMNAILYLLRAGCR
jgi:hypothetical protein